MSGMIDLCGKWELVYSADRPEAASALPDFDGAPAMEAVPGYWEDMLPALEGEFAGQLRYNPEYEPQRYPMTGHVPDMVLKTLVGCFWYRRRVFVEAGQRILFSCGGVQNRALLWVNGRFVGEHRGYSTPFSFDITELSVPEAENELILAVANHEAHNEAGELISGCTSRAANLYTGGITGPVCLKLTPRNAISDLYIGAYKVQTDSFTVYGRTCGEGGHSFRWEICDGDTAIRSGESDSHEFEISRGDLEFWSPEVPKLYRLKVALYTDGIRTDVSELDIGIRCLVAQGWDLRLNSKPVYLRGICEHGYFAKTVHPDPDIEYYLHTIAVIKELGFNFIRFHTWIPTEEYMTAADRLGMLLQVESPNNTTEKEWEQIMAFVRRHPSAVICCCGNELHIDEPFLAHLERCATITHAQAPGMLFSPMSALRGVEYTWTVDAPAPDLVSEPFPHSPGRLKRLRQCSDLFNSYALGHLSYDSTEGDPALLDSWAELYGLPRLSHEICIHGTYINLDLERRYDGTRIGQTALYSSVREDLEINGMLDRARVYYVNSCRWQQEMRKHCFENTRLCRTLAGFDFLGDIDHHWHTFGYRAGMMNEFYEMKPGETVENVRRYNGESVLLTNLGTGRCFGAGEPLQIRFLVSLFGGEDLEQAALEVELKTAGGCLERRTFAVSAQNGGVRDLAYLETVTPGVERPTRVRICARLRQGNYDLENRWEIWVFPLVTAQPGRVICTRELDGQLMKKLDNGADVLLLGCGPFAANPMSFRISLAGRNSGNLATVIGEHPLTRTFEHDGFCSWQFADLMNGGECLYYSPAAQVPFDPIIDVASSYKWIRRQAALVEFRVGRGRLLISAFRMGENVASRWWLWNLLRYMNTAEFCPRHTVTAEQLRTLFYDGTSAAGEINHNVAANVNDKTMKK